MTDAARHIQFALISHTNAGKTTLARTLIGSDVGEVRDAPHVTTMSESHTLLATDKGDTLLLWDTPGFGDSVRLYKRLAQSGNPIGWFLREVVDRYRDRPFWLSQQAVRTARDAADVVLYLVNSAEDPKDTGYLAPEINVLQWIGKPVVILLNQTGPPRPFAEELAEQARWCDYLAAYPVVQRVMALDAFARCWVHERVFYQAVSPLLTADKQDAYARLLKVWEQQNETRFQSAMGLIAQQIFSAAQDSEPIDLADGALLGKVLGAIGMAKPRDQRQQNKAMNVLMTRLDNSIFSTTGSLLALHRLDAGAAKKINERVQQGFVIRAPIDKKQAGLLGAALSGAATGLSADLMAGGMTFGAGALVGSLVGALTFSGAAWVFNASTDRNQSRVSFSDDFLRNLLTASLLRYLAVAHFGRGRGNFVESEAPAFWQREVEAALALHEGELIEALHALRAPHASDTVTANFAALLARVASHILTRLYPEI
jgi:Domain of unknown function (DUF3482)/50S ribosome-binding GTPase